MEENYDLERDVNDIEVGVEELPEETLGEFEYDEDSPNLAVDFAAHPDGKAAMAKISMRVKADFDDAWEGSTGYRNRVRDDHLLFSGDLPEKEYPFKGAANMHVPIVLENLNRLTARGTSELFGDWSNVFGVTPVGPDDDDNANILSKHGNWQVRQQIPDFKRQMHRAALMFYGAGDVTCHSYYDPIKRCNRHDVLTCDEFVVPHTIVSTMPDYSDLPYYCKIMHYHRHELQAMRDIWYDVDHVLKNDATADSEPDSPLADGVAQVQGVEPTQIGKRVAYKIIHFEGWLCDLPNQTDDRFCKVIFDHTTGHVFHMSIHEEDEWRDKFRYTRELGELQDYRMQREQYDGVIGEMRQAESEAQAVREAMSSGIAERAEAGAALKMMAEVELPPAPPAPSWMNNPNDPEEMPRRPRKAPIRMFSHGVNIEPLTGVLGMGFSRILGDLNRAANVTVSQFMDAAHLANAGIVITPATLEFENGFKIRPGAHLKVKGMSGSDIREAMYQFQMPPANPQLLETAQWATQLAQSSVQAPDVLSGESGKSGETFRGINSRIEQATKQLQVPTRKFSDFIEQILKNNAKLNAIYLEEEEIVNITDPHTLQASPLRVTRAMYDRDYRVEFRSDLRFTSQAQRVSEADEILGMITSSPVLSGNMAITYAALKKALEVRSRHDLVPLLGPPPPPPTEPIALPPPPPPEGAV